MALSSSLTNVVIKNNTVDKGITSSGTHTYAASGWVSGDAVIDGNTFISTAINADMFNIDSCSCIITNNKFIRASVNVNSYIRIFGSNDQSIIDNIFDGYTIDGSSKTLVLNLNSTSIYERNKNQTTITIAPCGESIGRHDAASSPSPGGSSVKPYATTDVSFVNGQMQVLIVNSGSDAQYGHIVPIDSFVRNGALLSSVTAWRSNNPTHVGLPAKMPKFGVFRVPKNSSGGGIAQALLSDGGGYFTDPTALLASFNTSTPYSNKLTTNQNNTIDKTSYSYLVHLVDEGYTNALSNFTWCTLELEQLNK